MKETTKKEYGEKCPKCSERQSINYANNWGQKYSEGVEMHWSCNNCGETFTK